MSLLVDLTLRGSILAAVVLFLDVIFGRWLAAGHRRLLWLCVPFAFLVPVWWRLPLLRAAHPLPDAAGDFLPPWVPHLNATASAGLAPSAFHLLAAVWALGILTGAIVVVARTVRASRHWDGSRFSTDSHLLELVEDCRSLAGVSVPVGVVVTDHVGSPALLGWLRPKLLLPARWLRECPAAQLRDVLLHELAHLRSADLAWGWMFTAMRLVHWFNPLVHLTAWRWHSAREDAADEFALRMRSPEDGAYEETLLAFLKSGRDTPPFGALGISERFINLKHRIQMIQNHPRRVLPPIFVAFLIATLAIGIFLRPTSAETPEENKKAAAAAAMTTWLKTIDDGDYAKSWKEASRYFREAVKQDQWIAVSRQVRQPLGACKKRELASILLQDDVTGPNGTTKGEFAIAQFKTSFANLLSAIETVTFQRENDGAWRASGYYIKPAAQ